MKIRTLWDPGDPDCMPWLVDAVDEYTIEENDGLPPPYEEKMTGERRELIIEIPDSSVLKLFKIPTAVATVAEPTKEEG